MDGAGKKRKLFNDDLDEEDEEEKIERFFALIKGIREARDRLMNVPDPALKPEMDGKNQKRKLEEEKKQVTAWKPLFQREDFMEETEKLKELIPAAAVSSSLVDSSDQRKEAVKNDDNKASLDLNLSLWC
ncbi:PROTEIN NIM1-INTERACTING 3-LIKE [Salix viminalis]|uniref:PROTEIN NIM1-INTERACTING 3-LIKE n=1 Tax=Salix viminalis TaxID=40686 RepID=A0A6N2N4S5_SALVM|nr:PROTEIN NIM1-INTERACTING 3-LIKE [Salix viminalis]